MCRIKTFSSRTFFLYDFCRAVYIHRRDEFARFLGDLVMQPTYLHKRDAPLCFPFSLRALYCIFSKRRRTMTMRSRGKKRRRRKRRTRAKSLTTFIRNITQFHYSVLVFHAYRHGRSRLTYRIEQAPSRRISFNKSYSSRNSPGIGWNTKRNLRAKSIPSSGIFRCENFQKLKKLIFCGIYFLA